MAKALLSVQHISKRFGATRALKDVSLELCAGEVHCVLGENGAGKSSIGKIIGGLHHADEGQVIYNGKNIAFDNPRSARLAGIVMVYQELSLAPHLSVRANLWLGSEASRFPLSLTLRRHEQQLVQQTLDRLGLGEIDMEQEVGKFPVAIQQLFEIGKSLMSNPSVIIFDEPTAMLGAVEKESFFKVLKSLRNSGIASILVTHHIDDVLAVSDRVTVMRDGEVIDAFTMTEDIDSDHIVTRLTGKLPQKLAKDIVHETSFKRLLDFECVATPTGPRMLSVGKGEVVGLYGVVGCGSETLVQGLVGLVSTENIAPITFQIDGKPFKPKSILDALRKGVSYLPAGRAANGVLPTLSISDNLLISQLRKLGRWGFINPQKASKKATELLEHCQVKYSDPKELITNLSGGNQQKVILARAMAAAKILLVLEEPTAGVDIDAKHQIHQRIRTIAAEGISVVMVSSDLVETIGLCDTIWTLSDGHVVGVYRNPKLDDRPSIIADVVGQRDTTHEIHNSSFLENH